MSNEIETKTQDDGYQELDVSKTTDKVEYELEDGGSPDKGLAPSPTSEPKDASPSKTEDSYIVESEKSEASEPAKEKELEGINTAGAEKRIRQLIKQRKEREEQLAFQESRIKELEGKLTQSTEKVQKTEIASLANFEGQLKEKLKLAEQNYKDAFDSGDKDRMLDAQKTIADATTEIRMVDAKRFYMEDQAAKAPTQPSKAEPVQQPQPQSQPQPQKLHEYARDWISENSEWYNKDRILTQTAHIINEDIINEGYDPESKEFYNEISKRLKKEMPHKFGQQEEPINKPAQVVAGKSRSSATSKGKIRLSQEDVRLAKKMNVPLDVYAKEKAKVEKAGDDYTYVNA
jgi:hypothetical protein|tara:strand:+ start:217 stop:1254 length:1038 start_codon:yes stop_codon:yes gene_type:complete